MRTFPTDPCLQSHLRKCHPAHAPDPASSAADAAAAAEGSSTIKARERHDAVAEGVAAASAGMRCRADVDAHV
eukprot:365939-Chlamydomonas_euryale.AAC.17